MLFGDQGGGPVATAIVDEDGAHAQPGSRSNTAASRWNSSSSTVLREDRDDDGDRWRLHGEGDPLRNTHENQSRGAAGDVRAAGDGAALRPPGGQE